MLDDSTNSPEIEKIKKDVKTIMFIKVKKDTTVWNLMAIFITPIISTAASAYVNVMMPYLLQDKDYFGFSFDSMG